MKAAGRVTHTYLSWWAIDCEQIKGITIKYKTYKLGPCADDAFLILDPSTEWSANFEEFIMSWVSN